MISHYYKNMKIGEAAAEKLDVVIKKAFGLIFNNLGKISEYDIAQFILAEFKQRGLEVDKKIPWPIVAAGRNTQFVHYHPQKKSALIKKGDLIMLDIWARPVRNKISNGGKDKSSGHFADITWMGFAGEKAPEQYNKIFNRVISARDEAVKFIRRQLRIKKIPSGAAVDKITRDYFKKYKLEKYFLHGLGHSLGRSSCHGHDFRLAPSDQSQIKINVPFTIEPGLYFKNKFGMRSEIDCYIDKNYRFVITTKIQKKLFFSKN